MLRSRKQSWILSLLLGAVGLWLAFPWEVYSAIPVSTLSLVRGSYVIAAVIPSLLLFFALSTLKRRIPGFSFFLTVFFGFLFAALSTQAIYIRSVNVTPDGVLMNVKAGFSGFAIYFVIVGFSVLKLLGRAHRAETVLPKERLKWISLAFVFAGMGVCLHFISVQLQRPLGQDYFVMAFALALGYAVLWKRPADINLAMRNAVSSVVTAILAASPLLLGRVFAPIIADLPSTTARFEAVSTLLATLSFFSIAVVLVRYSDRASTRNLSRLFLFAALLNAAFFVWAVPHNSFSIPVLRLTYLLIGCTLISWIEYRMAYFETLNPNAVSVYKVWRWCSYVTLFVAGFSPYVLRGLEYYLTTRRPYSVIPGSLHNLFHEWWILSYVVACVFISRLFWKRFGESHKVACITLVASMIAGAATLSSLIGFGLGVLQWPWHISLEVLTASGLLATFLLQPQSDRHPTPQMFVVIFFSTAISCLAGFMLFYGLWMQLLAGLLLAVAMPKIAGQFRDSAQALVDHYLFSKKYSYLQEIQQIGEDIFRFTNLPGLLRRLANDLAEKTQLTWVGIWLFDLSEGRFILRQAAGRKNTSLDPSGLYRFSFKASDVLPTYLQSERGLLIADELASAVNDKALAPDSTEARAVDDYRRAELSAAFPLYLGTKLIGFIGLGAKEDLSAFHQGDRETWSDLGQKAERAIGQAYMLYEQSLMFSKLAHDTLNYLQAMGMNMDILKNEYLGPMNDRQKKQLAVAAHQRELIRESLVDLRELERLMVLRMQGTWRMEAFDLPQVVHEAIDMFSPRFSAQNVNVVQSIGAVTQALGDSRAIRRVVDNLLVNALKFTPSGGRVDLRLYQKGDNLIFDVQDTGPGIPEGEVSRIFDPFYQASNTTAIPRGTGLGLSVVKEVVALHKGKIHVATTLGSGTLFSIEIPSVLRQNEFTTPAGTLTPPSEEAPQPIS